ncbi:MAG: 50S ribosomal protein L30 [Deltaproteobacteria bacterium]|nr:50S ribosomal protein L30 [Deltaproteobacteria bacterium]
MSDPSETKVFKITQTRSEIGCTQRQRQTLRGIGLTRLGRSILRNDSLSLQGMLRKVSHLIEVCEHGSK